MTTTDKIIEAIKDAYLKKTDPSQELPESHCLISLDKLRAVLGAIDSVIGEQDKWISVKERIPTKYGKYLCFTTNGQRTIEIWNGTGWAYHNDIISHWQPLPAPPLADLTQKTKEDGK